MNRFDHLIYKYKRQLCSREELEELLDYLASGNHELELQAAIERQLMVEYANSEVEDQETEVIFGNIREKLTSTEPKPKYKSIWWISTAAAILIISGLGIFFYKNQLKSSATVHTARKIQPEILPGGNRAILTLANGKTISLTNALNGKLAQDGGISVSKTRDGQLVYAGHNEMPQAGKPNGLNTITIPRGGIYDIVLADGTHVWLNSGSSLAFPSSFSGTERQVQLTGEAYFEVARNGKPFKVITATQTVQVLGTHFNIEAYQDEESVKTTLLEGSVKVIRKNEKVLLTPGQMSVNTQTQALYVRQANLTEVMDWKSGLFIFDNENVAEVMRKVARWYDVEVEYKSNIGGKKLVGIVSRNTPIEELLDNVALAGKVKYKLEGRRIVLMK
jgi:transmembrane sensor